MNPQTAGILPRPEPTRPGPAAVRSRAPNWEGAERVRWVRGLQPLQRRLLTELAWESTPHTGLVSPGDEALLAARVEAHVTSMRNALRALIDAGHVQRVRRGARGRPAVYRVTPQLPAGAPPAAAGPARPAATEPQPAPAPVSSGAAAGSGRRARREVTEYRQSPLMAAVADGSDGSRPGDWPAADPVAGSGQAPEPTTGSPLGEATPTGHHGAWSVAGNDASAAGEATRDAGGVAPPSRGALPVQPWVASAAGEVLPPAIEGGRSPAGAAPGRAASPSDEARPFGASPGGEAPPKGVGLDLGVGPQPPSPPARADPAAAAAEELVDAAVAVLPLALRPAITAASRRTLAAAGAGLVGRWSPEQVRQRLTGDLPASVKNPGGLLRHKLQVLASEVSLGERSGQAVATQQAEQTARAVRAQTAAEDSRCCRDRAAGVYRAHPQLLAAVAAKFYARPGAAAAPASVLLGTAVCRVDQAAAAGLDPAAALRMATADVAVPGLLYEAAAAHAGAGLLEQVRAVHAAATSGAGGAGNGSG